jgi:hypothetical protein
LIERIESTETRAGVLLRRTTFRRPSAQSKTVRIDGPVSFDEPFIEGELRIIRFEGFYIADTVVVSEGCLELAQCAVFNAGAWGTEPGLVRLSGIDSLFLSMGVGGPNVTQLEYCTVLGDAWCESIRAVDSLFVGGLFRPSAPFTMSEIECLRNVRIPQALLDALEDLPTDAEETRARKREQLRRIQRYTTDTPVFFEPQFGLPGAGVLHPATPVSIGAGAEDGSELGAYHHQHLTLRTAAVTEKLAEFLPFGMQAVLIPDSRLMCAPPDSEQN